MKRLFFGFLIATAIITCCNMNCKNVNNNNNNVSKLDTSSTYSDTGTGKIFKPTNKGKESTDYTFDLKIKLPKGFYFDTIVIKDSIRRAEYELYCLQSSLPGMVKFNRAIRKELVKNVKKDMQYVDPYNGDEVIDPIYNYELGPFEFYISDKLLSLCCIIDTYTWGGNHHNYSWYTFNFNLMTNTIIRFKDVFKLKNSKDLATFAEIIKRHQQGDSGCTDWESPIDSVDFSFVKKGICINPELSWACGMQRAFLTPDSLKRFMNNEWWDLK